MEITTIGVRRNKITVTLKNITFVTREELLKSFTEKEADELIALIVKKGKLTKGDFLRESQLSKAKATGLTK